MNANSNTTLLILDLDETMIHASVDCLAHEPDFRLGPYHVYRRPFLSEFVEACKQHFRLAIWSSATADYVQAIIDQVVPKCIDLEFVGLVSVALDVLIPNFKKSSI